jgi:GNAT superfamily N-acetyltransferase
MTDETDETDAAGAQDRVTVRIATQRDRPALQMFHRELYVRYRDQIMDPELADLYAYRDLESALRDDVDSLLHNKDCIVMLADRGPNPVGYITGHVETDDRRLLPCKGVVEDWLVSDVERGQGIGKQLMDAMVNVFRQRGCQVLESGTWAFNDHARTAHAKAGFSEIEVRFRRRLD